MSEQFGIGRHIANPMRPGKYHICRYLKDTSICGIGMGRLHGVGQWNIERALRFAESVVVKHAKQAVCKRCLKAAEKLRPVLERMAEL